MTETNTLLVRRKVGAFVRAIFKTKENDVISIMSDEDKQELMRLLFKAGFHARSTEELDGLRKAVELAISEGWNADCEDDVDYMHANIF